MGKRPVDFEEVAVAMEAQNRCYLDLILGDGRSISLYGCNMHGGRISQVLED